MKHDVRVIAHIVKLIRPRAGAWIETCGKSSAYNPLLAFAPARGRGLKHDRGTCIAVGDAFAPARGRGLKRKKFPTRQFPCHSPPRGGVD